MSAPTQDPSWATDPNYTSGAAAGAPTRIYPSAGNQAQGFDPKLPVSAQKLNALFGTHGDWINYLRAGMLGAVFGPGTDGLTNCNGVNVPFGMSLAGGKYTMTRDVFATDCMISAGVRVETNGFRLFVNGTLTTGTGAKISADGPAAVGAAAGVGAAMGTIQGNRAGGAGGTGSSTNGTAGGTVWGSLGSIGGAGGASVNGTGGAHGAVNVPQPSFGAAGNVSAYSLATFGSLVGGSLLQDGGSDQWIMTPIMIMGGSGGGGGGGITAGASGGGGGAGGGVLCVAAYNLVLADGGLEFTAVGGAGAAATGTNAGGGGGGGGGVIILVCCNGMPALTSATNCAGGAGGARNGTGANGTAGTAGQVFGVPFATSVTPPPTARHVECTTIEMNSSGGSGNGYDFAEFDFAHAFANATGPSAYVPTVTIFRSDGGGSVPWRITTKTVNSIVITPDEPFQGEITIKVEEPLNT